MALHRVTRHDSRPSSFVASLAKRLGGAQIGGSLIPPRGGACALLAISFLAAAIVAGLAFGTLTALGAGLTVVTAVELAAVAAVGLAAWTRVRELYSPTKPGN
jgi:hypothetical protein